MLYKEEFAVLEQMYKDKEVDYAVYTKTFQLMTMHNYIAMLNCEDWFYDYWLVLGIPDEAPLEEIIEIASDDTDVFEMHQVFVKIMKDTLAHPPNWTIAMSDDDTKDELPEE